MHSLHYRNRRNRYLTQVANLAMLADVTGVELSALVRYFDRLRNTNLRQEVLRATSQPARCEDTNRWEVP